MEYETLTGLSVEESRKRLTDNISVSCSDVMVPLEEAWGRIISKDIIAREPVPDFERSAMDGYAVMSDDVSLAGSESPVQLKVTGEVFAGDDSKAAAAAGTALRVMTGAMIPEGFDAVIRQEDTDCGEDTVRIFAGAAPGKNICPVGENIKKGEKVLKKGDRIGRMEIGLLSSMGISKVPVKSPVRAGIISTGDELTAVGKDRGPAGIYGNISYMLSASVRAAGFEVSCDRICPDDAKIIKEEIRCALAVSDVVITTGGVSVGKKDLIPEVLDSLGAETLFYGSDIKPGAPTRGSVLDGKVILSLSGNPYAALVNFDLYFWDVAAKLTGSSYYETRTHKAILLDSYENRNDCRRFLRARFDGEQVSLSGGADRSSVIGDMAGCNCYVDVPAGKTYTAGDIVDIVLMQFM